MSSKFRNEFHAIGAVADDPQQKFKPAANGKRASIHFDIKIPRDDKKDVSDYIPVVLFGSEAEKFVEEVSEGDIIQIIGRFEKNKNLTTKQVFYVIGDADYDLVEKRS